MRYDRGRKAETRARIVETAGRRFREHGIDGVGIAGLMADAGLTHGGFYAHFPAKEALVAAAVEEALDVARAELAAEAAEGGIEGIVRAYLSPAHRDRPDRGCAAAALAPEIARHALSTRVAFAERVEALVGLIGDHLPGTRTERQRRATALFALMMGTLQLARSVPDAARSAEILEDGTAAALNLAGALAG